jgi:dephospho-CoA kinase/ASC-1-like (ASCH) protein
MINVNKLLYNVFEQAIKLNNHYWIKKLLNMKFTNVHLAIMIEPYLSFVMKGKKTIESRFSQRRISPFMQVSKGDVIMLKKSGGTIVGVFEATKIHYFEPHVESDIVAIKEMYNNRLCCSEEFWNNKKTSHYASLIEIENLMELMPTSIAFKNRQAWLIGNELQEKPMIICVSGEIASGKTYIANKISEVLECSRYSVSDFMRYLAECQGIKKVTRKDLQIIGKEQIDKGWSNFIRAFIDFTRWEYNGHLIIDGVRQVEFLQALDKEIKLHSGLIISIFVDTDIKVRNERLKQRGEVLNSIKHIAEGEPFILKEKADIITYNNDIDSKASIDQILKKLFEIHLQDQDWIY